MVIGHNPGLEHLTIYLSKKLPQPTANGKRMPTAALATLRHDGAGTELNIACCSTTKIKRPSELKPALHSAFGLAEVNRSLLQRRHLAIRVQRFEQLTPQITVRACS